MTPKRPRSVHGLRAHALANLLLVTARVLLDGEMIQRPAVLVAFTLALASFAALSSAQLDIVLYNPSDSVPRGFYQRVNESAEAGALVTVRARDVAESYAAQRQFTDDGDRFLKRVAAARGRTVCAIGAAVTIDGVEVAQRANTDSSGRSLPTWYGCRTLSADEVFLLGDTPDSFDGRYWGPVSLDAIEGVWRPWIG